VFNEFVDIGESCQTLQNAVDGIVAAAKIRNVN
jgi:hypothetical protein